MHLGRKKVSRKSEATFLYCRNDFTGANAMTARANANDVLELVTKISSFHDDTLITAEQIAALTGFAAISIKQGKVRGMPAPDRRFSRLRWRLGDVRAFVRAGSAYQTTSPLKKPAKIGRPTKAEALRKAAAFEQRPTSPTAGSEANAAARFE